MKTFLLGSVLFFCTVLIVLPADAQNVYTWTDKNGVVHMEDRPPLNKNDVKLKEMKFKEKSEEERQRLMEQRLSDEKALQEKKQIKQQQQEEAAKRENEERKARLMNDIKTLDAQKAEYQQHADRAKTSRRKTYWRNQIDSVNKLIDEKQQELKNP